MNYNLSYSLQGVQLHSYPLIAELAARQLGFRLMPFSCFILSELLDIGRTWQQVALALASRFLA